MNYHDCILVRTNPRNWNIESHWDENKTVSEISYRTVTHRITVFIGIALGWILAELFGLVIAIGVSGGRSSAGIAGGFGGGGSGCC